jgi:hypothetical protein
VSWLGFFSFSAVNKLDCWALMVEIPLMGAPALTVTLWRWIRRNCASAFSGVSSLLAIDISVNHDNR